MVSLLVEECLFLAFLNTISSLNCCLETELKLLKSMRNSKLNKQFPRKMRIPVRFLFYFFELAAPQCFRRCSRSCIHSFLERFKFCSEIQMIFFFEVFTLLKHLFVARTAKFHCPLYNLLHLLTQKKKNDSWNRISWNTSRETFGLYIVIIKSVKLR